MSLDDVALACQHAIDLAIRRFRRGARPAATQRRFLVIQIDGLVRAQPPSVRAVDISLTDSDLDEIDTIMDEATPVTGPSPEGMP